MKIINRLKSEPKKYWIIFYYDDDKKTFNPGLQVSDWSIVQEIERITCKFKEEGRKTHICHTPEVHDVNNLQSQEECINAGPPGYSYDPFLIW